MTNPLNISPYFHGEDTCCDCGKVIPGYIPDGLKVFCQDCKDWRRLVCEARAATREILAKEQGDG